MTQHAVLCVCVVKWRKGCKIILYLVFTAHKFHMMVESSLWGSIYLNISRILLWNFSCLLTLWVMSSIRKREYCFDNKEYIFFWQPYMPATFIQIQNSINDIILALFLPSEIQYIKFSLTQSNMSLCMNKNDCQMHTHFFFLTITEWRRYIFYSINYWKGLKSSNSI